MHHFSLRVPDMGKIDIEALVQEITKQVAGNMQQTSPGSCGKRTDGGGSSASVASSGYGSHRRYPALRESSKEEKPAAKVDYELAKVIDHTLLLPDASNEALTQVCDEAKAYHFATVCVNAVNIPLVANLLAGSDVLPIAVVGFPLGASTPTAKAFEAEEAVRAGAREIDMVINIGALKSKDYGLVLDDIRQVVRASKPYPVKVILETSRLNDEEKVIASALSKVAGAAFVKTSTGFGGGGATVPDITLMRRIVGDEMGVKASGGVRSREDAVAMLKAGATRIGASSSVHIVEGKKSSGNY